MWDVSGVELAVHTCMVWIALYKSLFSHNGKRSWGDLGVKETEVLSTLDQTLQQAKTDRFVTLCCKSTNAHASGNLHSTTTVAAHTHTHRCMYVCIHR